MAGQLLDQVWAALGGAPAELDRARVTGPADTLPSTFPATEVATAVITASLLAATIGRADAVELDTRQAAVAVRSERYLRRDGQPGGNPFDVLSTFHRTRDGWIRLHANYPWHRMAALRALGVTQDDPDPAVVSAAIARRGAVELEQAVIDAGGVAAAVRTEAQWADSAPGRASAALQLLELRRIGDAAPRPARRATKVLDLTRVIAGPVATRTLAAHGAQVLRLDDPARPELPLQAWETLAGKRSALLDLATPDGAGTLERLLTESDVVVTGYRPGALDRFGLSPEELATRHPGLVVLTLSAWGHEGPWANRRGFDSVVQAATGISFAESADGVTPGALPAQLLDHATGYLGAAAAHLTLADQRRAGGSWHARLSLAQTATWLLGLPRHPAARPAPLDPTRYVEELDAADGRLTVASPPGRIGGQQLHWPTPPPRYGSDPPEWA